MHTPDITTIDEVTMERSRRTPLRGAAAAVGVALSGALAIGRAQASQFPTRAIRMIIPYPPGGAGDIVGRLIGAKVTQNLGQPIVIDNKGGGAQVIATEATAHAAPDGYTIFLASTTHSINPALRKLPYGTLADFTPITLVASSPSVFVVHPSLGVTTIQELVAIAKAAPGTINYGSSGPGTGGHLAVELLKSMANIDMTHVPCKGAAPALTDLLAGQVQVVCTSLSSAIIRFAALWSTRPFTPVALSGFWRIELRPSGYFPDWKLKGARVNASP
jgi:tripartite-type tricarboxylate transporter receptor subunit TctC